MPPLILPPCSALRASLAAVALLAFSAAPASSQIVFDDFNDGDTSDISTFSGGPDGTGVGAGPTTGVGGAENTGLNVGMNPGPGGGFAGFVIPGNAVRTDVSSAQYLTFYFRPTTVQAGNLPMTLEINLQEDSNENGTYEGATEDEYQAVFDVPLGSDYVFVEIPLYAFADDNSVNAGANDGFDYTKLFQIVGAVGGLKGPEFAISFDEIIFTETSAFTVGPIAAFDDFNDGNVDDVETFAGGTDGIGIGKGPTTGVGGADNTGLSIGINPGNGGGFAGFVLPGGAGVTDISGSDYLSFYFRPTTVAAGNLPLKLEINLQEDSNGNGTYEGATEDEYQAVFDVPLGSEYVLVQIPLYAFADDNSINQGANDGFDYTKLLQVVGVYGGIQGPEFAFAIDEFGFASGRGVATEELPAVFSAAPMAFPNPTAGAATVAFELASASTVSVDVVDLLGRRVVRLAEGAQAAGAVRLDLPTGDLAPGVYLVRVQTEAGVASTRLTVLR